MNEMERPKIPAKEIQAEEIKPVEKKEYGRNVYQRVIYVRHGDKAGEQLSEKGREQAREFGQTLDLKDVDVVKPYGGNLERARETVGIAVETIIDKKGTEGNKEIKVRERSGLGPGEAWDDEFNKMIKQKMVELNNDLNQVVQWEIDQWGKKIGKWAPEEIGINFADRVLWQCKMPERYKSGSRVSLVNGTHTGVMELGLKVLIGERVEQDPINPQGKNFIEKIGGGFGFTENFEVITKINEKGQKTAILVLERKEFPRKEYELDLEKIQIKIDVYRERIGESNVD